MRAETEATSHQGKTVEQRENISDNACGLCRNFSENAYESDGRGSCRVLKLGSDISRNPPVLVTEGDVGLILFFDTDGASCPHFTKQEFIDKDGGETSDPVYRRAHRQLEKK